MGTIPGPIISFRISQPELNGAVAPAFAQIPEQAKTVSNQIADDWRRMAAQIRASVAQGAISTGQEVEARKNLVSILDRQLTGHRQLNELST
jgi:hypothetical protein